MTQNPEQSVSGHFAQSVRSLMVDNDKREITIVLREFPDILLTATNIQFENEDENKLFKFSIIYTGESKDGCEQVSEYVKSRGLEVGNYVRSVGLPAMVGVESIFKTLVGVNTHPDPPSE